MKLGIPVSLSLSLLIAMVIATCSAGSQPNASETDNPPDTTAAEARVPEVETMEVTNVTTSTASGGGQVLDAGSASVTERGICWDTLSAPTVEANKVEARSVSGSGEFTASFSDLQDTTTYYARAYAVNSAGAGYGQEQEFTTMKEPEPVEPIVYLDSTTFRDTTAIQQHWNIFYPWGTDHNGSARMYADQVSLDGNGTLRIEADRIDEYEGESSADPYLRIWYHSGTIHYKDHIVVNDSLPRWEISGDFQVPTDHGTWPAFWITGANDWPPEIDIMEFKGNNTNWQNTVTGPNWQNTEWQTEKTEVQNAGNWHNYKTVIQKVDDTYVEIDLYIDGEHTATHRGDFVGDPFWLIINLQMEGASGDPGPDHAVYRARNIYLSATPAR